jgi:hypothetical protein
MKTTLIALLALGLCLPLAGAEKDKPAPKQTLCPLMVDTEIDEEEFIIYRGVKVFMCCGSCKKIWR